MKVRQFISSDLKREQIEIIFKLEVPSAKINQISSFDVVVDLLKIFALLFLSSLLYWFSAKVGVLCQGRCHFPDDLAQSVHQPPTLVSTFLPLTLIVLKISRYFAQILRYFAKYKGTCPLYLYISSANIGNGTSWYQSAQWLLLIFHLKKSRC